MPRKFLTTYEMAEILGVSYTTLWRWRVDGKGPRFEKFGGAIRYYPLPEMQEDAA